MNWGFPGGSEDKGSACDVGDAGSIPGWGRSPGQQPTRLPRPWDSPGKNTGMGCHFRLQCMKVKSESEVAQSCPTLSDPMDCSLPGSSVHGVFQARVLEWGAIACSVSSSTNILIIKYSGRKEEINSELLCLTYCL